MGWAPSGDLQILYRSLSPARRTELLMLALLIPVTAIAEMAMIAAIVPFLSALVPGSDPETVLAGVLTQLEGLWTTQAMAAAVALFIPVVIVASILRLALAWKSLRFSADLGHDLNMEIQRRMLHQPYLFHVSSHSSRLLASLDKVDELILGLAVNPRKYLGRSRRISRLYWISVTASVNGLTPDRSTWMSSASAPLAFAQSRSASGQAMQTR